MARGVVVSMVVMTGMLLAGCDGGSVNKNNFDKITNGMSQADVESILGKGTEEAGGSATVGKMVGAGKIMSWKDGEKTITVTFVNDKVTLKTQSGL